MVYYIKSNLLALLLLHLASAAMALSCNEYIIYSPNKHFFLRTVPFNHDETIGKTEVYSADSTLQYTIPLFYRVYKNKNYLLLSNNGETLTYIANYEYKHEDSLFNAIRIYKHGNIEKTYPLFSITGCKDSLEKCTFLYNIKEKNTSSVSEFNLSNNLYLNNDTAIIFCNNNVVLNLSLSTGNITTKHFNDYDGSFLKNYDTLAVTTRHFEISSTYGMPNMADGKTLNKTFASYFKLRPFPEYSPYADQYKKYYYSLKCIIDTTGHATVLELNNNTDLTDSAILSFFNTQKFETEDIPHGVEKWCFEGWYSYMNKNQWKAMLDKDLEEEEAYKAFKRNLVADSIGLFYIPKNIEECFTQLNALLKPIDIETIKKLSNREETIRYHHDLGMWLRNNWGMWGGSRLQTYMEMRGIYHPDSMSSTILEFYYDWLNGINEGWKKFDAELKKE